MPGERYNVKTLRLGLDGSFGPDATLAVTLGKLPDYLAACAASQAISAAPSAPRYSA